MRPVKCLRNNDAMGILFIGAPDTVRKIVDVNFTEADTIFLNLTNYGLNLHIKDLVLPIQESMFGHLATTGFISVYAGEEDDYEMVLVYNIPVDLEKLNQAIGAYSYKSGAFIEAS